MKHLKAICISYLFLLCHFLSAEDYSEDCCCHYNSLNTTQILSDSRLEIGYNTGRLITIDRDYTEIGTFIPVIYNGFTPFFDGRAYRFNDGKWGSSIGLGLRTLSPDYCSAWGFNIYYDYLRGFTRNNFNQLGVGFEYLGHCWDLRINGYFPVGNKVKFGTEHLFDDYEGPFVATCREREFAYAGVNVEFGAPIFCYCNWTLYGALAPYYYQHKRDHHFWGALARIELALSDYLSIEVRTSYDHIYKTRVQGRFLLTLPFEWIGSLWNKGCSVDNCGCDNRLLVQPVRRIGIIQTDHCCDWRWNW